MICSLNEIEALSRKAARGAGMSWGLAEEAGKAVRWLSDNGFPGPWLLSELLSRNDGRPYADLAPHPGSDGIARARRGPLCPIIAGALICDRADDLKDGTTLRLGDVAMPLLLAPFACEAARTAGVTLHLSWAGATLDFGGSVPLVSGDEGALVASETAMVTLSRSAGEVTGKFHEGSGREVTNATVRALESYAQRTYAPATAASRAGAGE